MPAFSHHQWASLTTAQIEHIDMGEAICVLPVAAVEQHGPHLPLGTDTMIMEGYLARLLPRLPAGEPVLFLPVQSVGASREHENFPGTLSLAPDVAMRIWGDMLAQVAATGCRKLLLLNSHGGNVPVLDLVAREARAAHDVLAVTASWHRFGYPEGLFSDAERLHGIHGGDIETSLMLAFRPELVNMALADDFVPASVDMAASFTWLRANHPVGFGWMAEDLSARGAMGNAALATRAKGELAAEHAVKACLDLLQDIKKFDLARLRAGPFTFA
ncbi:MAG: creatininase family protein [Hyphomicrobiales bacterium]|nr:creatininase family protein [Hyphomicrobiales bacterium]